MKINKLTVIAGVVFGLAACVSQPREPEDVTARAQQRWDLLIAGEYGQAYSYLSRGYRSTVSPERYDARLRSRSVKWLSAEVHDAECEAEGVCTVKVTLNFEVQMHVPGVGKQRSFQPLNEKWLLDNGVWYFLPKD